MTRSGMLQRVPPPSPLYRALTAVAGARLARNTGSMLVGQGGRVVLQGAYFVVIARALGVDGFGAFAGLVALVYLIAPFGSLGAINLMIRHIVNQPSDASKQFATAISVTVGAGLAMTTVLVVASPTVASKNISLGPVAAVCLAELLGSRLVDVAGAVYSARELMLRTAVFQLWFNGIRLTAACALLLAPVGFTLGHWTVTYLVSSAIGTVTVLGVTLREVGVARPDLAQFRREWREGIFFSLSLASQTIYNDIDKVMLARLSTLDATGIYTAAYRLIDMSFTPMRALLAAAYPRFFAHGVHGLTVALRFTRKLAAPGVGYCVFASLVLFAGAGLVPLILGPDYGQSVGTLRELSVLPILKAIHYLASDTLTGSGHQGMRSLVQVGIAIGNVLLNFALIPRYSYQGAVVASIVSDALLAALMWVIVVGIVRRRKASLGQ